MKHRTYGIKRDPDHGFHRLDPVPSNKELGEFYESRYYDLIRKGGRAPELRRLRSGGEAADRELTWLRDGLYTDIIAVLDSTAPGRRLLDIGCGTGDFIATATRSGFKAAGIEPAREVVDAARERGLDVHCRSLEKLVAEPPRDLEGRFDVLVMLNVLEHVPDPVSTVDTCRSLLSPGGVLVVRVPNDFTEIQAAAAAAIGRDEWWIAVPDHINYFDFDSLHRLLENRGFEIAASFGDFPMELFLLMGHDYITDPDAGSRCLRQRVAFDLNLGSALRLKLQKAFADAGVGRNCLVFGTLVS